MSNKWFSFFRSGSTSRHKTNAQLNTTANSNPNTSLTAESILIEEFNRANIASYKSSDELFSTFNIYLVLAGIITTAVVALEALFYQIENLVLANFSPSNLYLINSFQVDIAVFLILFGGYLIGFPFLRKFNSLANDEFRNTQIMNKIKKYYIDQLKPRIPIIEELLYQGDTMQFKGIPSHIFFVVSVFGSICLGGASYLVSEYASDYIRHRRIFTADIHDFLTAIFLGIIAFFISFFLYRFYYRKTLSLKDFNKNI